MKKKKSITASKLRENVYRILDEIVRTGVPVEIERNGRVFVRKRLLQKMKQF